VVFAWSKFELALYQQIRMGGFQSTTLRIGLACLKVFEYVRCWAKEEVAAQADLLHEMASSINNRPFTGCVSPIPDKIMIANFTQIYGVIFQDYVTTSMTKKIRRSTSRSWLRPLTH
jgi:hypothetical protein